MIPTKIRAVGAAALLCAALAGCADRPPKPPKMAEVFPNLPLPPGGVLVGKAGGADALQLTLRSDRPSAEIEAYYKRVLSENGWRLVNQLKAPDGAMVLLAEQNGPPLWVRIVAEDSTSTMVELAGARMERRDTTRPKKPTT
jgi:hypothetical protein